MGLTPKEQRGTKSYKLFSELLTNDNTTFSIENVHTGFKAFTKTHRTNLTNTESSHLTA
jgi:hypothetical protein